ncbi:MAG: substrate-binding domain-containing protein [Ilumatobacteraceae bacterium]
MKKLRYAGLLAVATLAFAACGGDDGGSESSSAPEGSEAPDSTEAVDVTEGEDIEIAIITHGDGGVFWSVAQKGAEAAGEALGITIRYIGSNNTGTDQAAAINQAVADGVDGIGVSLADPDAVKDAVAAAVEAGIPVVTLNSGSNLYKDFGAFTHIGQDEFQAGQGAGEKFNAAGATKVLCAKQEQTNTGLDARCNGLEDTFEGEVVVITTSGDASGKQQADLKSALDADPDIDGVFGTGPVVAHDAALAAAELGRELTIGGVDLSTDLLADIEAGTVAFTIDQQQYLQGYVAVIALYLNATNANTLGGGLPIATGPGFVTADNVAAVAELVAAGTR